MARAETPRRKGARAASGAGAPAARAGGSAAGKPRRPARGGGRAGGRRTADPAPPLPPKQRPAQAGRVERALRHDHPGADCSLDHRTPFELLVATILSAQCTDERVNLVTPKLFAKYPGPAELAEANPRSLESVIRSTGFFRNKAKSIRGAAQRIAGHHAGEVPRTMEELLELPGVARKTANVVLGTAYGIAEGVVVDTHVFRVSRRLGLTGEETPGKVEADLMELFPRASWIWLSHAMILHGRRVCIARAPRCEACSMRDFCPSSRAPEGAPTGLPALAGVASR